MEIKVGLTDEQLEEARQARLNEVGTMPDCPFCQRPRVQRSDYVRCNKCGINWLNGEDMSKNPLLSREPYLTWSTTRTSTGKTSGTAPIAESSIGDQ